MSWESVVDTPGTDATADESPTAAPDAPSASSPLTVPAPIDAPVAANASTPSQPSSAPDSPVEFEPIAFAPLTLSLGDLDLGPTPAAAPAPAAPVAAVVAAPAAPITPASAPPAPADRPVVTLAPLAPIVPAFEEPEPITETATASTSPEITPPIAATTSSELPTIVEATPVPEETSPIDGLASTEYVSPIPSGPRLPSVQQPSQLHVAPIQVVTVAPTTPTAARRKRKGRRGLKLVLTLVVLGGLIAGGIVFGRQYLLPGEWDATTEPYGTAVEEARGAEFAEPIALVAEPSVDYNARMAGELTGEWVEDESMWRSLGLISGVVTVESVGGVFDGWQSAIYSTDDGQVYSDQGAAGPQLDAVITQQMVAAQLDQQYGWSADQSVRTLDDAAQTLAEVQREARRVQRASVFATELEPLEPLVSVFAPPVLGYRALAPSVFAEFVNPATSTDPALDGIGSGGPGPLPTVTPGTAPNATMITGDVVATSPRAMDRAFWYLVFAGYLETRTAYNASESVVDNSIVVADRGAGRCAYATFAGSDVAQTATLRPALETWAERVPAEMQASFSVLPDGTLQLVSCDPGAGFDNASRLGIARELIGWRMAELATIEAVADVNGGPADFDAAWAAVLATDVGVELATLPPETSPADAAAAARGAVGSVLVPSG